MAAVAALAPAAVVPGVAAGTTMIVSDIAPNQTLYLNNLNEKIKKGALKKALYAVFSQFGPVMDVVTMRTNALRGQAWVVFENTADSTNALRQMQGFPFFDKPMVRAPRRWLAGAGAAGWRALNFRAAPPPAAHPVCQGEV